MPFNESTKRGLRVRLPGRADYLDAGPTGPPGKTNLPWWRLATSLRRAVPCPRPRRLPAATNYVGPGLVRRKCRPSRESDIFEVLPGRAFKTSIMSCFVCLHSARTGALVTIRIRSNGASDTFRRDTNEGFVYLLLVECMRV